MLDKNLDWQEHIGQLKKKKKWQKVLVYSIETNIY